MYWRDWGSRLEKGQFKKTKIRIKMEGLWCLCFCSPPQRFHKISICILGKYKKILVMFFFIYEACSELKITHRVKIWHDTTHVRGGTVWYGMACQYIPCPIFLTIDIARYARIRETIRHEKRIYTAWKHA